MQKLGVILIGSYACRHFSVGSMNCKKSTNQEARVLAKLMKRGSKGKWGECLSSSLDLQSSSKRPSPHVTRRVVVLNKTYMNYVVQIMSSCSIFEEIVGMTVEISHVQITNDFKFLNIFWFTNIKDANDINVLEERLHRYSGQLRHKLAQLRVIGKVPILQFVRNRDVNVLYEIDRKLANADFGEDYERSPQYYKSEQSVTYSVEQKIEKKNSELENVEETFSITLPKMRHDVLGIDCSRIMQQIQVSVNKKVAASERRKIDANPVASNSGTQDSSMFLTNKEQEMKFKQFLRERRKQERQKREAMKADTNVYSPNEDAYINDFADDEVFHNESYLDKP